MRTAAFAFGLFLFGCTTTTTTTGGSPSSSSSSSGGGSSVLAGDACNTRCVAKAEQCGGVPATQENPNGTEGFCADLCATDLTDEQMTCLEGKSCSELASGSLASLCPRSSSSSSSSSSSGGTDKKKKGDACTCEKGTDETAYKTCTGNASACYDLDLDCLAKVSTGQGTCVVTCSSDDDGQKCPSGGTCQSSGKPSITGDPWYVCL